MGFAQKLGEFAGGVSEGLLPGIQLGTGIAESKGRRAVAAKREQRLATAADRSMLWSLYEDDPSGATRKAEELGLTDISASMRAKSGKAIQTSFASAGEGIDAVGSDPPITDFSLSGLQAQAAGMRSNLDAGRIAGGAVDVAVNTIDPSMQGMVDPAPLQARRGLLTERMDKQRVTLTATESFIASVQNLNYNDPDYQVKIEDAVSSYVASTGDEQTGNSIKLNLLGAARDSQERTYKELINAVSTDPDALKGFLLEPIVQSSPFLSTLASGYLSSAARNETLPPAEVKMRADALAQAKKLEALGVTFASTDPETAREFFGQANLLYKEAGWDSEAIAVMENNIDKRIEKSINATREEKASTLFTILTSNEYGAPVSEEFIRIGKAFGIEVSADGVDLSTDKGKALFNRILDAMIGVSQQEPEPAKDGTDIMIEGLNKGNYTIINSKFNSYLKSAGNSPAARAEIQPIFERARVAGWEWIDVPSQPGMGKWAKIVPPAAQALPPIQSNTPPAVPESATQPASANSTDTSNANPTAAMHPFLPR